MPPSTGKIAAVTIRGLVGSEINCGVGNVFGFADTADRHTSLVAREAFSGVEVSPSVYASGRTNAIDA
jgi:hypothetical protein